MFLIQFLLLLLFDFGNCDLHNITILHLGEYYDTATASAISKAVNYINENENFGAVVQVYSYEFITVESLNFVCEKISDEIERTPNLILDTTSVQQHAVVAEKVAVRYGLPTISTSNIARSFKDEDLWKKYDPEEMYLLKVFAPGTAFNKVIKDIIHLQAMTNVAVIFTPEFVACKSLKAGLNAQGIPAVFIEYPDGKTKKITDALTRMYFQNIFLLGNISIERSSWGKHQVIYSILVSKPDAAATANSEVYAWPEVKNEEQYQLLAACNNVHINYGFYFDLTLLGILSVKSYLDAGKSTYEGAICDDTGNYPSRKDLNFRNFITKVPKPIFGDINFKKNNESLMEFNIKIAKTTNNNPESLGTYKVALNSTLEVPQPTLWKAIKTKAHYKVLARIKPPFVYYNESTGDIYGYNIDLLDLMASILEFTYEITAIKCGSDFYGDTKQGFISKMLESNTDIGLGPVYPSMHYETDVDFSIPYYKPIGIKFIMKRSKDDSIFTFITVLETIVWVCILSAFFINSFMLWAAERFSPYSYRNNKEKYEGDEETRDFTAKESLWFCLTSLTPQGGGIVPKHFSGRLVVVTWWLFGFIILASYTANLAAFLTLSKLKNPIESFTDLYRQFRMYYAPLNGSDEEAYFMNILDGENEVRKSISANEYPLPNRYARMKQIILNSTLPNTVEEALERVYESKTATEGFAFLVDSMDAKYLLMTRCNLIDIEEEVGKRPFVIALKQFTLLKHSINKALTIILQKRLDEVLEKKWWDDNPYRATNCVELEDESEGIGIYNIGGVFLIIFIGVGVTSLTIAYEYWMYLRRHRPKFTTVSPLPVENDDSNNSSVREFQIPKKNEEVDNSSKLQHRSVTRY